ncbi:MAG: aminotransferase class IV, partial [Aquificaceae bacterium]
MEYIFFEGDFVSADKAKISIMTNSFHYGTAIFEGIRAYWNQEEGQLYVLFAKEHYQRLLKNCKAMFMEIPYTVEELVNITVELLRKNQIRE